MTMNMGGTGAREWRNDAYSISTDKTLLQVDVIHAFLMTSYWAGGIPREVVARSIASSLCFGLYRSERQIGFGRAISDYATFAYVADVFILEEYRGNGLGRWLIETILGHPDLQGLRRWLLATRDAHWLYRKVGFADLANPLSMMEKRDTDVYKRSGVSGRAPS